MTGTIADEQSCPPTTEAAGYLGSFDKFSLTYFDGRLGCAPEGPRHTHTHLASPHLTHLCTTKRGLAEVPRTLLHTAGQPFEDVRLKRDEFDSLKGSGDLKKNLNRVPILNHNGEVFGQSGAINRYLAQKFGMFGSDAKESWVLTSTGTRLFRLATCAR